MELQRIDHSTYFEFLEQWFFYQNMLSDRIEYIAWLFD